MSILDRLLETDIERFNEKNSKKYEIKRLSSIIGEKFIVECRALSSEQVAHIGEISKNNTDTKINAVLESCRIEGKKLNNTELLNKFNCVTGKDIIEKLFNVGEVFELYNVINDLSGYNRDAVKEIKNY